jgi:hypothetical protein
LALLAVAAVGGLTGFTIFGATTALLGTSFFTNVAAGAISGAVAGQYGRLTGLVLSGNTDQIGSTMFRPRDLLVDSILGAFGGAIHYGLQRELPGTTGKTGEINWPPKRGFLGEPERITLQPGTRVDRYGYEGGTFVSPEGTPYEMRSLPSGSDLKPYYIYKVVKPVEVDAGPIRPWFEQPGLGIQYEFSKSIKELLKLGILRRVRPE